MNTSNNVNPTSAIVYATNLTLAAVRQRADNPTHHPSASDTVQAIKPTALRRVSVFDLFQRYGQRCALLRFLMDHGGPMAKPNKRRANGWERDKLVKRKKALGLPCHLCGYPIDYNAHYMSKRAFVLDELTPISKGGKSTWDNTAPAHRCCNSWRGAKDITPGLRKYLRNRYEREILGIRRTGNAVEPVKAAGKAEKSSRCWG